MALLLIASFVWAFSFGLIKTYLAGLDASFVAFVRLALAALVFLPLLRLRKNPPAVVLRLLLIGMVQFGLMYVFYIQAFRFLAAHQVALFTIFTPLYVAVVDDIWEKRFRLRLLGTALLAVAGTAVIVYSDWRSNGLVPGFLLVQASNACFALGQIAYRRLRPPHPGWQAHAGFAWLYLGGMAAALLAMLFFSNPLPMRFGPGQLLVLLYLGVLASGIGFFMWNTGATRVQAGVLAVFNNVKVPLAVLVSLLFFGERTDGLRLFGGGTIIALALWLNRLPGRGAEVPRRQGKDGPEE
jgi:carboxylate/amino acid/amine transporter